jgi:hypothetical protein
MTSRQRQARNYTWSGAALALLAFVIFLGLLGATDALQQL